jgi:hypothetical protein
MCIADIELIAGHGILTAPISLIGDFEWSRLIYQNEPAVFGL